MGSMTSACMDINDDNEKQEKEVKEEEPLFSVGLIADTQYADADIGYNYTKTRTRRYRQALTITENAVKIWNDDNECIIRPSFIISLGDVIDLKNKNKTSVQAMNCIMKEFDKFNPSNSDNFLKNIYKNANIYGYTQTMPDDDTNEVKNNNDDDDGVPFGPNAKYPYYHNCAGNHEMYNFDRKQLEKYQYCPEYDESNKHYKYYYSFKPNDGYLFIILDAFEISVHGYEYIENKHKNYEIAQKLLAKYNPNENKNIPPKPINDSAEKEFTEKEIARWTAFNGGFGNEQLLWLENQLKIATEQNDKVIIFSHVPVMTNNFPEILAFDCNECNEILTKYCKQIKLFIAGHDHDGDRLYDEKTGITHITMEGVIESEENTNCFATAYFYENKITFKGYGKVKDFICSC